MRPAGLRLLHVEPADIRDVVLLSRTSRAAQPLRDVLVDVLRAAVAPYDVSGYRTTA